MAKNPIQLTKDLREESNNRQISPNGVSTNKNTPKTAFSP